MIMENIRLALSGLKANKMRALLTMLGIIIGISSVIAIMTVGNSMTIYLSEQMSSMGASNVIVMLQQRPVEDEVSDEGYVFEGYYSTSMYDDDDLFSREMIENYCNTYPDEIVAISAQESVGTGQIVDDKLYANITMTGVSAGVFKAENIKISAGRYFTKREMEDKRLVGMISDKAVNNMFDGDYDAAVGSIVDVVIGDKNYNVTVTGVYKYEQSSMNFSFGPEKDINTPLYIPVLTAQEILHTKGYTYFTVMIDPESDPDMFAGTTQRFFNTYYRNNRDFQVSAFSLASMVEMMSDMMGRVTLAISVIAGIALLVGGIGVMNIMLVSITERTREIGTRKALGAPNSSIRMQFIVESIVICTIGGIIGITLGVVLGIVASKILGTPAEPSIKSIFISLGFSMGIGVFFGYHPANKAAKMDPIDALRYE